MTRNKPYLHVEYAIGRLVNTFVRHRGQMCWVSEINEESGEILLERLKVFNEKTLLTSFFCNVSDLKLDAPPLGYTPPLTEGQILSWSSHRGIPRSEFQSPWTNGGVLHVTRDPSRQYRQGLQPHHLIYHAPSLSRRGGIVFSNVTQVACHEYRHRFMFLRMLGPFFEYNETKVYPFVGFDSGLKLIPLNKRFLVTERGEIYLEDECVSRDFGKSWIVATPKSQKFLSDEFHKVLMEYFDHDDADKTDPLSKFL